MFQLFRTTPHSLCLSGANVPTRRRFAPRSSAWATLRTGRLWLSPRSPIQCAHASVHGGGYAATCPTLRGSWHRPRPFSSASVWSSTVVAPSERPAGLGYPRRARALPAPSRAYPPKYGVFGPLFSCPRHSPEAPFFGRLDALTIQDGRASLRVVT